jgi:glycosyltransferase involved in cell wall biosynthesis
VATGTTNLQGRRVVFVSNVFPNHLEPTYGIFNLQQLLALTRRGWAFSVVAPVLWFPLHRSRYGSPAANIRGEESVQGIATAHPRAIYVPLSRGVLNARLYEFSIRRAVRRACLSAEISFIWSSFVYPDGIAAGRLSRKHGLPHVVSAIGSDLNVIFKDPRRRVAMRTELTAARLVLAKSGALRDLMVADGVRPDRVVLDYNGVDRSLFRFRPAGEARAGLGAPEGVRRILFVGGLLPVKAVGNLLDAFASLGSTGTRDPELIVVGDGFERGALEARAVERGIAARTRFLGRLSPAEIALWMNCSDLLCLPSLNEGVPNVVLEALASGCPVVATRVGGIPEVHPGPSVGALVPPGDVGALTSALGDVLTRTWDRPAIASSMDGRSWEANAEHVEAAFRSRGLIR